MLRFETEVLAQGTINGTVRLGDWQRMRLDLQGAGSGAEAGGAPVRGGGAPAVDVRFSLNGTALHQGRYTSGLGYGMAGIGCGYHFASFDNFNAAPVHADLS